jgi:glycerol-3-phosphate cytidylyltransferase
MKQQKTVVTFGTFDLFHIGHVNILTRAAALGDRLIVGISSDELNEAKKGRRPIYTFEARAHILNALDCVDGVFVEHSLEKKRDYLIEHKADVLVMGDDWAGKFDEFRDICEVVYLPRTKDISTTELIHMIKDY